MIRPDINWKLQFFDSPSVIKRIEAKERRVLSKAGAFIRTRARSSIRRKKRPTKGKRRGRRQYRSAPGKPPFSWQQPGLKDIIFVVDPRTKSVSIGPIPFNGGSMKDIPGTLEQGGPTEIRESRYKDRDMPWQPGTWKQGDVERRTRKANIKERPFMGPARDAELPKILDQFGTL